ncbi:hypothetical protein W97_04438 [Coniosporium apollinis CBS 100218]|uniref:Ig-like domain-containing protein n=1 Tax=Coniosporium apollinis (strain CBS 100218) TaxID=1168221 RepID=R7YU63_CONA1|nr:uncharacterized protein W97_04438 [Coniosporium apollinis CBS 100218]EON65201.1 hypothetical protein W97_04438 [Coniosporium apollinis CBS 100218]
MFAFIIILLLFASGFPLSVFGLPAPTVAVSNGPSAAMAEAMAAAMPPGCGADWISVFPWTNAGYTGEWQPKCGAPGVCQSVPAQLNDKISSFGISGPTGRAWCQLFQHEKCTDPGKSIFAYTPGLFSFQHLERLDNQISSYRCFSG